MLEDNNENDSEMFSEVYALLDQLSNNSKEVVDIEGKDMDKIESIIVQRTNELSLAVRKYFINKENNKKKYIKFNNK